MHPSLILSFLLFYLVTTATCRTVGESIQRNSERQNTLKNYRHQFAAIQDALSGSVESGERSGGPSYRIDLGEALEAESFRAAAVSSDSLEYSHEGRNPEEGEVETTTLFPVQNLVNSNSHWLKSDLLEEDDMEEEEDDLLDDGCEEGEVMKVSCNSCVCINSQFVCSKKDCGEKEVPAPPRLKSPGKKKGTLNYNKKTDQAVAIDEAGNALYGEYFSSESDLMVGNDNNDTVAREEDPTAVFNCIDGRTKPVDCNQCICSMGRWACTKMSCIPMSLREKASFHGAEFIKKADTLKENMDIDDDCMEGDTKKSGCNQCVCHENSWACTDFACPSSAPSTKPNANTIKLEACQTEEDVKSVECNICSCRSGIWRCTNNDCKKFGDKYYQPINRGSHKSTSPLMMDSDSAENHSFL